MAERFARLSLEELRTAAWSPAGEVLNPGDRGESVEELCKLGMQGASSSSLGAALWQIWGRIFEEWTHPEGDRGEGIQWARESAVELLEALGDAEREREYCDRWIFDERLGIKISPPRSGRRPADRAVSPGPLLLADQSAQIVDV